MTILGYGALIGASLFYIGMSLFNASKPNLAGDNAMGYGLGLFFFGIGFAVCILTLAATLYLRGDFDWVSAHGGLRALFVFGGALALSATFLFCAMSKWGAEPSIPLFVAWIGRNNGAVWIPLLALIPAFLLLNGELRASVPPAAYQVPLTIAFGISAIIALGLVKNWFVEENRQQIARIEGMQQDAKKQHNRYHQEIKAFKTSDNILTIIAFTGRFHDEDVRTAALAKIKSKPDWEDELLAILESPDYFSEAYTFLDGNAVDHPERFAEPLRQSIFRLADEIHNRIKDSNNLQDWHFDHFGIERLFRAIDEQFADSGVDYVPAVQALQKALNTRPPERFKNVRFTVTPTVDGWLKRKGR
jgi:hypothetical protein